MLTEMSWLDIFAEPEPDDLPPDLRRLNRPLVLWYASPVATFGRWSTRPLPTRHVFRRVSGSRCSFPNRICSCTRCLDEKYEPWHEDEVLHEDYGTLVKCRSATPVRLDRQLVPWGKGSRLGSFWERSEASR